MERRMVATIRDCPARVVPSGTPAVIPNGSFITITQSLGGNYTVTYNGNMMRIDGTDADALGLEKQQIHFDPVEGDDIIEDQVWQALKTVYDPEIPVDIVNLGLVYDVTVDQATHSVHINMTLTAPGCGMGPVLVGDVEYRVAMVPNVSAINVDLIFDPPWSRDRLSDEAQLATGLFF